MPEKLLDALADRSAADSFKGFQCWTHAEVGEIMHREAPTAARAVLLATHQPPRIRRVTFTEAGRSGSEDVVTQDELLAAVVAERDKSLIVPVIGAPGTGKSHLVLWMKARLDDASSPDRKIIYVPKGETGLSRVIELLLDGRTGSPFDEIRTAIANATRTMTIDEAARRLRDELAVAVTNVDHGSAAATDEFRQYIKQNIADLLHDPVYAERLVGEGRPLRRIVEQALAGGNDEPAELTADDLDIELTAVELEGLSRPAKVLLGDLQNAQLHEAAIHMLNEVRDRCLSRLFGVEPMQLVAVMRELRTRLFEENPKLELVLMIEDFTLFQGIQHDLLEAMIELPTRDGRQIMCAMKTVMAVTDGFFSKMLAANDTLRTRLAAQGHAYNLDVPYGAATSGLEQDSVVQFVARYLNAVRTGSEALAEASPEVPNACEHCAHRDLCHDSFGTSAEDGYGLYPFNAAAIDRIVRSRQGTFNPRDLLKVMAETLTVHGADIADGRFPSPPWERLFDPRQFGRDPLPGLSLRTQEQVEMLPKADQRRILLLFWGGAPQTLVNLAPGIHEAFDIPPLADTAVVVPRSVPRREADPVGVLDADDDIERIVLGWRDGVARLDGDAARVLRRVFREAVLGALDGESALYSPQLIDESFPEWYVDIENSVGGGRFQPGKFRIEFAATNEHAVLFKGVLRAQRLASWNFDDGHVALTALLTRVDAETMRLREFIQERLAERASDHAAATVLLAISGLASGHGTAADARGLLAAAVGVGAAVTEDMPDRWKALVGQCDQRRPVARAFALQASHVSKSTTEPSAIDGAHLLPVLRQLRENWSLLPLSENVPQQLSTLSRFVEERLPPALAEATEVLREWWDGVYMLVGDPDTALARSKQWQLALESASRDGFLVNLGGWTPETKLSHLDTTMRFVDGVLRSWPSLDLGHQVAAVAKVPWARLRPLREQLDALAATLQASAEKAITQHDTGEARSPVEEFAKALSGLETAARISPAKT